jgi:hypothetical protein
LHCGDEELPRRTPSPTDVERAVGARTQRQVRMPERVDTANGILGDVVRRFIADKG